MRMGKVRFLVEYAVDLDNEEHIDIAKEFIAEDIDYASHVDGSEFESYYTLVEDPTLSEGDISQSLLECTSDYDADEVCEICGKVFEFYGDVTDKCSCNSGHVFCGKHLVNTNDPEFEDEDAPEDVSCKFCPVCNKT